MNVLLKRIIIADDYALVRKGMQLILEETSDLSITDEATNSQELFTKLYAVEYDAVILDMLLPGKDTMDVLKTIKVKWPWIPVVIFSNTCNHILAVRMIRNGASAFITKETDPEKIIEVLRTVVSGKKFIFPSQSEILAEMIATQKEAKSSIHDLLTDREFQIFFMLASGLKNSEMAGKLSISKHTLSNHRNNILKKMNLCMNSELTRYAIQHGIIH